MNALVVGDESAKVNSSTDRHKAKVHQSQLSVKPGEMGAAASKGEDPETRCAQLGRREDGRKLTGPASLARLRHACV